MATDPRAPLQYRRFTRLQSLLHVGLIVSFMTLALTGLTLKFSYTPWAAVVSRLFDGFETAGSIHRMAATLMLGLFATHFADLLRCRNRYYGGSWRAMLTGPHTLLPTLTDLRDFRDTMKWFIGRGTRPRYGRWTYWEKFDYFAVFWGIAIIGSTGLMLWFSVLVTHILPGWLLNVATIVHSDEALLATGFIFTVHFFNTHLRPEKFPMDVVVFTGRMPLRVPARQAARVRGAGQERHARSVPGRASARGRRARDPHLRLDGAGPRLQHGSLDPVCRALRVSLVSRLRSVVNTESAEAPACPRFEGGSRDARRAHIVDM